MTYKTIVMDPPWPERGGGQIKRGADRHYDLISTKEEILRVVLQSGVWTPDEEGAHLYMWVTNNYLAWGLWLMEALGFRYVTNVVWVKAKKEPFSVTLLEEVLSLALRGDLIAVARRVLSFGLGQYFRGGHELLLFGVKGQANMQVKTERKDLSGVLLASLGEHSQKPVESYELIEARSHGPYLEMFARGGRAGWASWGNEASDEAGDEAG